MDNFKKDVREIIPKDETMTKDKCIGLFSKGANIGNAPDPEEIVNEIDQLQKKEVNNYSRRSCNIRTITNNSWIFYSRINFY